MATLKRFEDIKAWQKARVLCKDIYALTYSGGLEKDFGMKDQMRRSCGSIMDNIAEGFERGGTKEFKQFLSYSKGSAGELKSQLYRALDLNYINQDSFDKLSQETTEIGRMIMGLINYLKNTDIKGQKYL